MKNKVIGSPLINPKSNIVTYSDQVQDIVTGKKQSEINNDVASLKDAMSNVGSRNVYTVNISTYDNKLYLPLEDYDFQIGDVIQGEINYEEESSSGEKSTRESYTPDPVKEKFYFIIIAPQNVSVPVEETEEKGILKSVAPPTNSYSVQLSVIMSNIQYAQDDVVTEVNNNIGVLTLSVDTYGEDYTRAFILNPN